MITDQQKEQRIKFIGSSDAPAICGVSPWRSPYDVWAEKTGRVDGFEGNEATAIGTALEDAILTWASAETGVPIIRNQRRVDGVLAANLDAIAKDKSCLFEAKTSGLLSGRVASDEWGTPGTDEVPQHVIIQVHHQMVCSGVGLGYVPALLGGRGLVIYRVQRDDELADMVASTCRAFWRDFVEANRPPTDSKPSLEILKRMHRESRVVPVDDGLLDAYLAAQAASKAAEAALEQARADLLAAMGDGDVAQGTRTTATYYAQTTSRWNTRALDDDHPELAEQYKQSNTYRVLRIKTRKEV